MPKGFDFPPTERMPLLPIIQRQVSIIQRIQGKTVTTNNNFFFFNPYTHI